MNGELRKVMCAAHGEDDVKVVSEVGFRRGVDLFASMNEELRKEMCAAHVEDDVKVVSEVGFSKVD